MVVNGVVVFEKRLPAPVITKESKFKVYTHWCLTVMSNFSRCQDGMGGGSLRVGRVGLATLYGGYNGDSTAIIMFIFIHYNMEWKNTEKCSNKKGSTLGHIHGLHRIRRKAVVNKVKKPTKLQ